MRRINIFFYKIICWLFGHDVHGKIIEKSSNNNAAGEWRDCWQYYCNRCQDSNDFPINQFPNRRNIYQRTVRLWITRYQNKKLFKQFEQTPEKRIAYLHYLDEQSKIYKTD